jgi:hypothetical protein
MTFGGMKRSFAAGCCEFDVNAPQPEKHIVVVNIDMTNAENLAIVFDDILHVYYRAVTQGLKVFHRKHRNS